MWILQFLPNWIFYALFFCGIAALLVTHFIKILPQAKLIQAVCLFVACGVWRALGQGSGAGQQLVPPGQKDDRRV